MRDTQTITAADVGPADEVAAVTPATPEEAAAADPHFRPVLHDTVDMMQNLRPSVEIDVELPHPDFEKAVAGETVKEVRTVPGFAFERKPNTKTGDVVVALVERDGGDRLSGRGKTTAEAIENLRTKLEKMGELPATTEALP